MSGEGPEAQITPVARQSLSDAVFEQLRAQIVGGRMAPGSALPAERVLRELLGVNRGAIREALKRLEQARLVAIHHGGSTTVLDFRQTGGMDLLGELLLTAEGGFDLRVARSVIEMRAALAPDIARLCALRGQAASADRLDPIAARMAEANGDLETLEREASEFWLVLVEGSDNLAYRLAYNTLRDSYARLRELLRQALAEEHRDLASYRALAQAVRRGDTAKAERRAAELVRRGTEQILEVLEALEAVAAGTPAEPTAKAKGRRKS
jgi:DNA-binding FadR family transcriptional regulator